PSFRRLRQQCRRAGSDGHRQPDEPRRQLSPPGGKAHGRRRCPIAASLFFVLLPIVPKGRESAPGELLHIVHIGAADPLLGAAAAIRTRPLWSGTQNSST